MVLRIGQKTVVTKMSASALLLLAAFAPSAQAQVAGFTCSTSALPSALRAEGVTELVGDIVLTCTGGSPTSNGSLLPTADLVVSLDTPVTSRLVADSISNYPGSEALLLVDEPEVSNLAVCGSLSGCTYNDNASGPVPNVFQGIVSGNYVAFLGVPIAPPGKSGSRVYRITNIGANASTVARSADQLGQVSANVAIFGASPFPINNSNLNVGFVQKGLQFEVRDAKISHALAAAEIARGVCKTLELSKAHSLLRFREGFATSFKPRFSPSAISSDPGSAVVDPCYQDQTGGIQNSESGFHVGDVSKTLATAGLAKFGTWLMASFSQIPRDATVWVSVANVSSVSGAKAVLVSSDSGPFAAVRGSGTLSRLLRSRTRTSRT